jgi:phosphoglycerate dehydrogenase-like enzyme
MDILIVEPVEAEALKWISARHPTRYAPELARDLRSLRQALFSVRALLIPPTVPVDMATLRMAPMLRAVGRLAAGVDNVDIEACSAAGVEVFRPATASAAAEAEFCIAALLQMLRRVPVLTPEGLLVGRELGHARVGLIGLSPTARQLTELLLAFGASVVGYDPAVHASDPQWARFSIRPTSLREVLESSDAVCVLLGDFTRYQGLIGERYLEAIKPDQVLLSLASSSLFDEYALAEALSSGRMAAAWFDSVEPGWLSPGRPLHGVDTVQVTPRVAATTRESLSRATWAVLRRIDEILAEPSGRPSFRAGGPGGLNSPDLSDLPDVTELPALRDVPPDPRSSPGSA